MKSFVIEPADAGKRLDKWLLKRLPLLPMGLMQKYIRLKRVKLNGKPAAKDARLTAGDLVELYIGDEFFETPRRRDALLESFRHHLSIVYEDDQLLLVDKRPGVIVHPDHTEKLNTLVTHARAYLYQNGSYDSTQPGAFAPVPCNRIDRFTGGIVIVAKTREAMHAVNQKMRDREIEKNYLCITLGQPRPRDGLMDSYILKQEGRRKVRVLGSPAPGAQRAQTCYWTLAEREGLALVRCELITGRTHQIRAQFAAASHPLLGDNQYGERRLNQRYSMELQALYAYRLAFHFTSDAGVLNPLNGKSFEVKRVPFVETFFPDFR